MHPIRKQPGADGAQHYQGQQDLGQISHWCLEMLLTSLQLKESSSAWNISLKTGFPSSYLRNK